MQNEELKPCPFCGGKNLRFRLSDIEGWIAHVECTDCDDMLGPMSEWKHGDKEDAEKDAAAVWNRRPCLEAALSAAEPVGKVKVHYAYCCPGSTKYCDCVNKNHGSAWIGANEVGDDYIPASPPALPTAEPVSSRNDEAGYVEFLNEDVPYVVRDIQGAVAILIDLETRNVIGYRVYDPDSVFAPQPAPSVAVKALEWKRNGWVEAFSQPDGLGVWYSISPRKPVHGPGEAPFSCRVIWGVPNQTEGRYLGEDFQSVEEAKAAAQADYEARIRSALSAQVQDVAGTGAIAALKEAEPYVEICHSLMTQKETRANVWRVLKQVRAAIAAAPAKQEGGDDQKS
jgi:Lar family restriction alleviation protein